MKPELNIKMRDLPTGAGICPSKYVGQQMICLPCAPFTNLSSGMCGDSFQASDPRKGFWTLDPLKRWEQQHQAPVTVVFTCSRPLEILAAQFCSPLRKNGCLDSEKGRKYCSDRNCSAMYEGDIGSGWSSCHMRMVHCKSVALSLGRGRGGGGPLTNGNEPHVQIL